MIIIASFNQFHHKYIYGEFANCRKKTERISHCLKWKMTKDDKHKVSIWRTYIYAVLLLYFFKFFLSKL